ncbi:MAG: hypothetical protein HY077_09915 [Elusimicrobia bacterium]|nr:hypothetical protein [Elusimicrobiota bacterium]
MTPRGRITAFVTLWLLVFNYESLRANYLGADWPKLKFLFPPAGWIMFYRVDKYDGHAEVYGERGDKLEELDPHRIFATRWLGYDNIRRNILVTTLNERRAPEFCAYLGRKFPDYPHFAVVEAWIGDVTERPQRTLRRIVYKC